MAVPSSAYHFNIVVDATMLNALLRELRSYDKDLYKEVTKNLVNSAAPIATAVGTAFPGKPPLEFWREKGRRRGAARMPPYSPMNVRRGVKAVVPRIKSNPVANVNTVGILRLQQMNAGGQVYDVAGSAMKNAKGDRFIQNLDKHLRTKSRGNGFRSRIMFPYTKKHLPLIEKSVALSIKAQNSRIRARLVQGKAE
jgi:hypothetical protein